MNGNQECLSYVNNLDDGALLNFSDLGRTFGLKDNDAYGKDNKNQVVKQFLVNHGINIDRFNYHKKMDYDQFHIRRKKLKLKNTGGNVSVPTDPCLDDIKRNLHLDILDGKYEMGKLIVPIKFWKSITTVENEIIYKPFEVEGRKTPLDMMRRMLYESHKSLYRIQSDIEIDQMTCEACVNYLNCINEYDGNNTDEIELKKRIKYLQRRRHLAIWHDGSSVSNHSHILFNCTELYDKAIHLTDEEARQKLGKNIDVQSMIETPKVYIFGRIHGSTSITVYSQTRMEDIEELKKPLEIDNGVEIYDIMRLFKGDGPSCQVEAGQQKGGNYFCWICGIHCISSIIFQ